MHFFCALTFVHAVNGDLGSGMPNEDSRSLLAYPRDVLQAPPLVSQLYLVNGLVARVSRGEEHKTVEEEKREEGKYVSEPYGINSANTSPLTTLLHNCVVKDHQNHTHISIILYLTC